MELKLLENLRKQVSRKAATAVVACGVAFGIMVGTYSVVMKDVKVLDETRLYEVKTSKKTVKDALEEAGVVLKPGDVVEPEVSTALKDELVIRITRAISVRVTADGKTVDMLTTKRTVKDVLAQAGIAVSPLDKVIPAGENHLSSGDEIKIIRVTEGFEKQKVKIPYRIIKKENNAMEKGLSRVLSKGKDGLKEVTYKVTFEDGREVQRQATEEKIITPVQNETVEFGTITTVATARGEVRFKKAFRMLATAYCACKKCTNKEPGHPQYGITYSGIPVRPGIVAVDPGVIPLGSRLYVEGYGFALAADIGGAIKGNRIDLYYPTHGETERYGARRIKVYLLE
jgi:uncharacterized protein YabE (DUF348 family)